MNTKVQRIVEQYTCIGIGGTRNPQGKIRAQEISGVMGTINPNAKIHTGCQKGIDAIVKLWCDLRKIKIKVFDVASGKYGEGKGAYARRTIDCIESTKEANGLWVAYTGRECPSKVKPSNKTNKCFNGGGSGTWAGAAYAMGLGMEVLIYIPEKVSPPEEWNLEPIGDLWYRGNNPQSTVKQARRKQNTQLNLFTI